MEIAKESKLMTSRPTQPLGKSQLYTLLVDSAGNPVLDADGNRQVVALQSVNGRMQVDASITGSLTNQLQVITNQVIAAGATFTTNFEKLDGVITEYLTVKTDLTHSFSTRAICSPDGITSTYWMSNIATTGLAYYVAIVAATDYMQYSIVNSDVASHTYNMWRRYRII